MQILGRLRADGLGDASAHCVVAEGSVHRPAHPGQPVARIVPARKPVDMEARRAGLEELRRTAPPYDPAAPSAGRSQDYLYDEVGAPK